MGHFEREITAFYFAIKFTYLDYSKIFTTVFETIKYSKFESVF